MKGINPRLMAIVLVFVFGATIFYACKKTGPIESGKKEVKPDDHFFEIPPGTDSVVVGVAASIKRQNVKRHFVNNLINKAGFALWDKARIVARDPGEGIRMFIPFVLEKTKQTRAILIVKIQDKDTLYHLLYNTHARHYGFDKTTVESWNAKDIFHAFVLFDYEIFGHIKFTVNNGRFVGDTTGAAHKIEITGTGSQEASKVQGVYPVVTWVTFITCGLCAFKETSVNSVERCCNATYNTIPVTYWFNDANSEWGYDLPSGYSENSGAMVCPGCSWDDTNPCDVTPPYTQICDAEWTPTLHVPEYTPFEYDSIHVSNGLKTVFPCVASFIKDSLSNANLLAQIAGADVFKDSAEFHLIFDTSTVHTTEAGFAGTTGPVTTFVDGFGVTVCHATIKLNPWYLRNGTKEFMVANILHEIMHATFTLRWEQYQDWLIDHDTKYDSNFIKTKFPMYWYAIQNQAVSLSALQEHEIMAADYLEQFSYIMRQFYNPNASTAIRDTVIKALAYGGLQHTTAWKGLPSFGMDTCKYKGMQAAASKTCFNCQPFGCSSNYVYSYGQNLKLRPHCQ